MKKPLFFLLSLFLLSLILLPRHIYAGVWTTTASMSTKRTYHKSVTFLDGRVLVTGGYDGSNTLSSCELYNPNIGLWTTAASMQQLRSGHTLSLLPSGFVLVTGGTSGTSCELYDPTNNIWVYTDSMHYHRGGKAVTLSNNDILVIGGVDIAPPPLSSCEIYDYNTGLWDTTCSMVYPRSSHNALVLNDGRVLVTGGRNSYPSVSSEIYNSQTDSWDTCSSMNIRRYLHEAALLNDGTALIVGGDNSYSAGTFLRSCERYDPVLDTFIVTDSMTNMRTDHAVVKLAGGVVLAAAGYYYDYGYNVLNQCEIYDPASGVWRETGAMTTPRRYHSAVILKSGKILVTGGDNLAGVTSTCEIYSWLNIKSPSDTSTYKGGSIQQVVWECDGVDSSRHFRLLLSKDNGINYDDTLVSYISHSDTTCSANMPAVNSKECRVKVQVVSNTADSILTEAESATNITIDSQGPYNVQLVSPDNAAYTKDSLVCFTWRKTSDSLCSVSHYVVESTPDSSFITGLKEVTTSDTSTTINLADSIIYWRVKAVDAVGNEGDYSDTRYLNIDIQAPQIIYIDELPNDTLSPYGPYDIKFLISDNDTITNVMFNYRVGTEPWVLDSLEWCSDTLLGAIPEQSLNLGENKPIYYYIKTTDRSNNTVNSNIYSFNIIQPAGVMDLHTQDNPKKFTLSDCAPNPAARRTNFKYQLPKQSEVVIELFDIAGRLVERLDIGSKPAGYHQYSWNNTTIAPGIYFYRLKAGNFTKTKKLLIVK